MVSQCISDIPIGLGSYTAAEVSLYTGAATSSVGRWVNGNRSGDPVVTAAHPSDPYVFTFFDLVQVLAIHNLRRDDVGKRIPLQLIRAGVARAEKDYGVKFPLAQRHCLYFYDGGIWIKLNEDHGAGLTAGKDRGQGSLMPIIEPFAKDLGYDQNGTAISWRPRQRNDCTVVLDPLIHFGQPFIEPSGLLASTLYTSAIAEGSFEAAAEIHAVDPDEVILASIYLRSLLPAA